MESEKNGDNRLVSSLVQEFIMPLTVDEPQVLPAITILIHLHVVVEVIDSMQILNNCVSSFSFSLWRLQ